MADGPIIEDEEERRRLRAEARKERRAALEKKVSLRTEAKSRELREKEAVAGCSD